MRAIFELNLRLNSVKNGDQFSVVGDNAHHLVKVVRIKVGEELVILNGCGEVFTSVVDLVSKKEVVVKIVDQKSVSREHHIELAVGITKREAFDSILKMSVELGITTVNPLITTFSQQKFVKSDRCDRLLISAIIQSNNPFEMEIRESQKLADFPFEDYKKVYYFCSNQLAEQTSRDKISYSLKDKSLILVGPEGGLSLQEEAMLLKLKNLILIHLPLPIMRAPTAVACAIGHVLGLNR